MRPGEVYTCKETEQAGLFGSGRCSLHTHTTFSDGDNTPEEMIEAAIRMGLDTIAFTDHSYTAFDTSYCMKKEDILCYRQTIRGLQDAYSGKIRVITGIEQDYFSGEETVGYDLVIGSVHYIKVDHAGAEEVVKAPLCPYQGDLYIPVDESVKEAAEILTQASERWFADDIYALIESYFTNVADVMQKTGADIIGHFDVITKCNTMYPIFDTAHPRYRAAWKTAADKLLHLGKPFEINLSPLLRGIKPEPYPSQEMIAYIKERGGRFVVTGDCHSTQELETFAQAAQAWNK